jgi:hypothetical protein
MITIFIYTALKILAIATALRSITMTLSISKRAVSIDISHFSRYKASMLISPHAQKVSAKHKKGK